MSKKSQVVTYLRAIAKEQAQLGYLLEAQHITHLSETMKRVWQKRKAQAALKQGECIDEN